MAESPPSPLSALERTVWGKQMHDKSKEQTQAKHSGDTRVRVAPEFQVKPLRLAKLLRLGLSVKIRLFTPCKFLISMLSTLGDLRL